MEVNLHTKDGSQKETTELPESFETEHRPDLIRRAFLASQANQKQPYGADPYAGMRTPAESPGSGQGLAHVPRIRKGPRGGQQGARVPGTVGGRKAHPPKAEKDISEDFNDKERKKAVMSAAAATTDDELVRERGHDFSETELPIVVEDDFEELVKTKEVVAFLEELGLYSDVERADEGRKIRSGQGKTRGRKYKTPRSILFVTETDDFKAARNLPGADVVSAENLGVHHLAPGGVPGRLAVWTESALEVFDER